MLTGIADLVDHRLVELPGALDYAVRRALEPDPERRFPTATAMRRSLKTIDGSLPLPRSRRPRPAACPPSVPTGSDELRVSPGH
jgi:hypothetical protein